MVKWLNGIDELKREVERIVKGEWLYKKDSGQYTFKAVDGAILNFWERQKTINIQGKSQSASYRKLGILINGEVKASQVHPAVSVSHFATEKKR